MADSNSSWFQLHWNKFRSKMVTHYQPLKEEGEQAPEMAWQKDEKPRRRIIYVVSAIVVLLLILVGFTLRSASRESRPIRDDYATIHWGPHWKGWHHVDHLVVLGDSWSSTGFDIDGDQPSAVNPIGNPSFPGAPVTDGQNWVEYLITDYNETAVMTLDLAVGGATVDTDLIKPGVPEQSLRSLKVQTQEFAERYVNNSTFPWTANSSLFSIWIGVNDITAYTSETKQNFGREFEEFAVIMDDLYATGARNFLLFNAPPLELSPIAKTSDPNGEWPGLLGQWNANFTQMVSNFTANHNETTTFMFDAHSLFLDVQRDPCIFEETCGFMAMTESCDKYAWGAITPDWKHPDCPYSVDKYFWINRLHPSTQTHSMIAHAVYDAITTRNSSFG